MVTRHGDVNALLRDRRLGRSYLHVASHEEFGRPPEPEFLAPFWKLTRAGMLDVEPPDHTRLRRLVSKAFTPRMAEGLRARIRALAGELARGLADRGGGDLLAEVAEPLPVTVIADMLGIPSRRPSAAAAVVGPDLRHVRAGPARGDPARGRTRRRWSSPATCGTWRVRGAAATT